MISVDDKITELAKIILGKEKVVINNKPYCLDLVTYLEGIIHDLPKNTVVRMYGRHSQEVEYCEVCSAGGIRLSNPPEDIALLQLPQASFTIADIFNRHNKGS